MPATSKRDWKLPVLALIPGIVAVIFYWLVYLPWSNASHDAQRALDLATAKAAQLDSNIMQLAQQLDGIARLPDVRNAVRDNDTALMAALSRNLSPSFAHLERLTFIPLSELGIADLGQHESQLRNNIEKDILRKAADMEDIFVDSYMVDGERVLGIARAVYIGNRSIGAILLTLKTEWLSSQLYGVGSHQVSLVYQLRNTAPITIAGNNNQGSGSAKSASLTSNPNFKVEMRLAGGGAGGAAKLLMLAVLAGTIVLPLLPLLMAGRVARAPFLDDITLLNQYVKAFSRNTDEVKPEFNNIEFDKVVATMVKDLDVRIDESRADSQASGETDAAWANPQVAAEMTVENIDEDEASRLATGADEEPAGIELPAHIFRAYDIRGHADNDLDDETARQIGQAVGSMAMDSSCDRLVVGRDGRQSSERLQQALVQGILSTGCDVTDIGLVATPVLYFGAHTLGTNAGVMVTGSHNPAEDNGFKIMLDGQTLSEEQIQGVRQRITRADFRSGDGLLTQQDVIDGYIDQIIDDVVVASPLKVVLDCSNGAASEIAPMLFASLGCEVVPLFAEIDGSFPNHAPDPSQPENLRALIEEVQASGADLGIAFDGDADRMAAVSASGQIVDADKLLMLFARDVVTRNPGADVVYDIKCSRHLNQVIANQGGRPVMWKSGHSLIKQKMRETGALIGGEYTGHFCFMERWYGFDDGLYSGARLIELLTLEGMSIDEAIAGLPQSFSSPEITVPVSESSKFDLVEELKQSPLFAEGKATYIDGIRIDYPEGWGLVRASNTSSNLSLRFEADSQDDMAKIQSVFKQALQTADPNLAINW